MERKEFKIGKMRNLKKSNLSVEKNTITWVIVSQYLFILLKLQ